MGDITVRITGVPRVISSLEALKQRMLVATREGTAAAGDELQKLARANFVGAHAPGWPHLGGDKPNVATDTLRMSIRPTPVVQIGPGEFRVKVGGHTVYANMIEFGGTIFPHGRYLSWYSPYMGRRMFKRSVTLRGWPYLRPADEAMIARMNPLFYSYWSAAWHG